MILSIILHFFTLYTVYMVKQVSTRAVRTRYTRYTWLLPLQGSAVLFQNNSTRGAMGYPLYTLYTPYGISLLK